MKAGDYARTCYGTIFRIENITEIDVDGEYFKSKVKKNSVIKDLPNYMYVEGEILNKTSPNIIDLIEVGDYVNGYKVYEIKDNCVMVGYKCFKTPYDDSEEFLYQTIYKEDIKSIVTHEQFESMEYVIGE